MSDLFNPDPRVKGEERLSDLVDLCVAPNCAMDGDCTAHQMENATARMAAVSRRSMMTDRSGWTDEQWADDAERLFNGPDGSVMALVNGHVSALLRLTGRRA